MFQLDQLKIIARTEYTLFFKYGCKYSKAACELLQKLQDSDVISGFRLLILGEDYSEKDLTAVCSDYGVEPQGWATKVPIPQVFMKGEYIGGSDRLYGSRWNLGDDDSGIILLYDEKGNEIQKHSPNLVNPVILED